VSQPRLKPLAHARRLPPLVGRHHRALNPYLEEQLFRQADVLSEGYARTSPSGDESYFGSTMIRLDLTEVGRNWRGPFDATAERKLVEAIEGSVRCHLRATRIACNEVARRVPGQRLGTAQVEVRMRIVGTHLHIDVDLEVPVSTASRARKR
jgi:hypothetical protein